MVKRFDLEDGLSVAFVEGDSLIPDMVAYPSVRDRVRILESGSVGRLYLLNENDLPVIIIDGEALKGGKQNRTLRFTLVLGKGRHEIPAFCIERGRWGRRNRYGDYEEREWRAGEELWNLQRAIDTMEHLRRVVEELCGPVPDPREPYAYLFELSRQLRDEIASGGRYVGDLALLVKILHLLFIYRGLEDATFLYFASDVLDEVFYLTADEMREILPEAPVPDTQKEAILRMLSNVDDREFPEEMKRVRQMRIEKDSLCQYAREVLDRYRRFYMRRIDELRLERDLRERQFSRTGVLPHAFRMMYIGADQSDVWGTVDHFMRMENVINSTEDFLEVFEKKNSEVEIPDVEVPSPATSAVFMKSGIPLVFEEIANPEAFRDYFPYLLRSFIMFGDYMEPASAMGVEEFLAGVNKPHGNGVRTYEVSGNRIMEAPGRRETYYNGTLAHRVVYNVRAGRIL